MNRQDRWLTALQPWMERSAKPLAAVSAAGMWVVLVMGAAVTNTGSATGCGPSWPLCQGQFIPEFAVKTAIEYSHRSVVAVLSIFIIALAVWALVLYRDRPEVRWLAPAMVVFLFLQAGLGAWAVMAPQEAAVLALHFGVSLIAFASVLLIAVLIFEGPRANVVRNRPIPRGVVVSVWSLAVFSYLVVYLGAYVRHRHAVEACSGWPLCNGKVVPGLQGLVGTAFAHRVAALALVVGIGWLIYQTARVRGTRPDLFAASIIAGVLVILQALSGALIVASHLDLFSALAHAGLVGLLFGDMTYLCLRVTRVPRSLAARDLAHVAAEPA